MIVYFFFNDTATTEIYPLSLHDALPICRQTPAEVLGAEDVRDRGQTLFDVDQHALFDQPVLAPLGLDLRVERHLRSEEHTSELQSRQYLVCRLLLEKKKKQRA